MKIFIKKIWKLIKKKDDNNNFYNYNFNCCYFSDSIISCNVPKNKSNSDKLNESNGPYQEPLQDILTEFKHLIFSIFILYQKIPVMKKIIRHLLTI